MMGKQEGDGEEVLGLPQARRGQEVHLICALF